LSKSDIDNAEKLFYGGSLGLTSNYKKDSWGTDGEQLLDYLDKTCVTK
jgi:hypothetical protein